MKLIIHLIQTLSIRRPAIVGVAFVLLLLVAGTGVFRIDYEDGLRSLFSSQSRAFQDYSAYARSFDQSESDIAIHVTSRQGLDRGAIRDLQDFVLDASLLDNVASVFSVFSLRKSDPESGALSALLPRDLNDTVAVRSALLAAATRDSSNFALISEDLRKTVLILSLAGDTSRPGSSTQSLNGLMDLTRASAGASGLTFEVTGLLPVRESIIGGLRLDQMRINLFGAVLGFAVSLIMFRSFWVALLNTITPVSALVFCLGAFGWLDLSINALTNVLPVLILVLASSDSIHITFEIRRRLAGGATSAQAITGAVRDIAPPCVLTSFTTILAFSSLLYSESPIIQSLAVSGAAGVFLALIAVLFVHPFVFVLASRVPFIARALPRGRPDWEGAREPRLFAALTRNKRAVGVPGLVLCVLGLWVMLPVQSSYRFLENVDATQPVAVALEKVERLAGPITTVSMPLTLNAGRHATDDAVALDLAAVHHALGGIDGVAGVTSVLNVLDAIAPGIQRDRALTVAQSLELVPNRLKDRVLSHDGRTVQVNLRVPDRGSQFIEAMVRDIDQTMSTVKLSSMRAGRPTGFLVMSSQLSDNMIRQLTISFLIAALSCPALIGIWFRRLDFALAAIVPNILPIIFVGAALTLLDFDIQFTSALALTIAFGVAVDDSIHVFNRLYLASDRGIAFSAETVTRAMHQVAPVLVATTAILASGLLATQGSYMPMIRFFGLLCIITFIFALLCDLILLPALVVWLGGAERRGDGA